MRAASALLGVVLLVSPSAAAQHTATRAWQQRLQVDVPLAVPLVELAAINPFAQPIDEPPRLLASAAPRKVDVSGAAVVAAYVDNVAAEIGAGARAGPVIVGGTELEEMKGYAAGGKVK
jgi:hypothetical protein